MYVLATSRRDVQAAKENLAGLSGAPILHVPEDEQEDVKQLRDGKPASAWFLSLQPGDWVRMRRGAHKSRLGRVRCVKEDSDTVVVAVVPLLPLERKGKRVPGLLDLARARELAGKNSAIIVLNERDSHFVWQRKIFRKGLQELEVSALHYTRPLIPSLTELEHFAATEKEEDILALSKEENLLREGDHVVARIDGWLSGFALVQKLDHHTGGVMIQEWDRESEKPLHSGRTANVARGEVRRLLCQGDYVKVVFGFGVNCAGTVVSVDDTFVSFLVEQKPEHVYHMPDVVRTSIPCFERKLTPYR